MDNLIVTIICGFLIALGTLGSVLPLLPGLPVAYGGLLLYFWLGSATDISTGDIWGIIIFGVLTLSTILVDVFAPALAAKGKKASKFGVIGAILGAIFGIFVMGPVGILLGPFLGAFIGEVMNAAKTEHALRVAFASMLGLVIGSVFKLIVGVSMFVYFLFSIF